MDSFELNNGVRIPALGLGTFLIAPRDAEKAVRHALAHGYSLIDTANAYCNEIAVGRAIRESGLPRRSVFLSTKLWVSVYEAPQAVDKTLRRLGTDYIDLLFIHQPAGNWQAGYEQLERAYEAGKIRAIGISDFEAPELAQLFAGARVKPQVLQTEAHPFFAQTELRKKLDPEGIRLMSWYPLGHGDRSLIDHPLFAELGARYGKTPAQVILRWHVQMGFIVIPGSKSTVHVDENADIFDFSLSGEDLARIARLDGTRRYYTATPEVLASYANMHPNFDAD
ncbi:aldo/keto reductase [Mesosutterella sp. OilRF-GAM-744-9]|uniref:Aldo/keto reductase n=1 Tax=Mesosutterella porci TaxID=2915351 RepID=A0ABS9MPZ7_9BURK|nr:aldo/keto reductase [Mesosutterella sp. oilRF-744-WT-GAM-9]MCG5030681.1 aldo/keto reductase [Mesosutterella sp. oilRF-744-WT-GAM-9]